MLIVVAVVLARCESGWDDDDDDSRVETKRRDDKDNDNDDEEDRNTDNADTEEPNRERMVLCKTMTRKGTIRMLCFVTGIMTTW